MADPHSVTGDDWRVRRAVLLRLTALLLLLLLLLVIGRGIAHAVTPTPLPVAPAADVSSKTSLGDIALIITAAFAGITGILGAIAQLIQARKSDERRDATDRDQLLIELLRREREARDEDG